MVYFLYVLECADKTLYTGITTDVDRRIKEHNTSKLGAKYTAARRPVKMLFFQEFTNRSDATKAEMALKKLTKKDKLAYITEQIARRKDT